MRLIYAEYNPQTNSIDVNTYENYILRIDCNKAENGLRTTPCSQNSLNALAIDEPLEYARLALLPLFPRCQSSIHFLLQDILF